MKKVFDFTVNTQRRQQTKMPPMAFRGVVTKAGCMNKTATITVSRFIIHKLTGKVRTPLLSASPVLNGDKANGTK